MALILAVVTQPANSNTIKLATWTAITNVNTTGDWFFFPDWADREVHIAGTFGASGTIVLEGTNDNSGAFANPVTLSDQNGNPISATTNLLKSIQETPLYVRPRLISGGDGTTNINVILNCRRLYQLF